MNCSLLYETLKRDSREVRLLSFESAEDEQEINLRLHVFSLQGAPKYKALSYVWGSPKDTRPTVVNGTTVEVSANLHAALLDVRAVLFDDDTELKTTYLWVDALCINQEDTMEKNHQVAMMDAIYSEAQEVLMWIRFEAAKADTALTLLEDWAIAIALVIKYTKTTEQVFRLLVQTLTTFGSSLGRDPFESSRLDCLNELIENEYWKRIWILQEVVLATSGRIIAGRRSISLGKFCFVWIAMGTIPFSGHATREQKKYLIRLISDPVHVEIRGLAQINHLRGSSSLDRLEWSLCGEWLRLARPGLAADSYSDIPRLREKTRDFSATDPRDRIFALQNLLTKDKRALDPDYGLSEAEVYTRVAVSEIQRTGTLRQLEWSGIGHTSNGSRPAGLPSWVPDISKIWISCLADCNAGGAFPSSPDISRVSVDPVLRHKGIFCGKLRRAQALEGVDILNCDSLIWKCVQFLHTNWGELQGMPRISSSSWVKTLFRCLVCNPGIPFSGKICQYFIGSMIFHADFDDHSLTWFLRTSIRRPSPGFEPVIASARAALRRKEPLFSSLGMILEAGLKMDGELEEGKQLPRNWQSASEVWDERELIKNTCGVVVREGLSCIFVSDDGFIGLAPVRAQEGDSICVLLGYPFPLVVRPKGDNWELVGLARIQGMMHGEMVEGLEDVDQVGSKITTICLA